MALTTVKSIETALNLIDAKKDNLKKAFENLQSHSGSLSSFTISWPDLDSHFTSLQSELLRNFSALKNNLGTSETSKSKFDTPKDPSFVELVPARPELVSFCQNMDGLGLRKYVIDRHKEITAIRTEMVDALKHSPDPGSMVLDALAGFCHGKISAESRFRTACVLLLEELMRVGMEIAPEIRERARDVAADWQQKIEAANSNGDEDGKNEGAGMERLGYLHLLAAYKVFTDDAREMNELIDQVVSISRYRQSVDLCRNLGLESRIPDVIQRLIMKGKQLIALRFVFEFGLSDQFPPVPLLKTYLADSKKIAQNVCKSGNNSRQALNEAEVKEINALKSVIKCVKEHGLESEYPVHDLEVRANKLVKEQAGRKRPAPAPVPKPQQKSNQQPKQNGKKRMRTAGAPSAADKRKHPTYSLQPSFAHRAGLVTTHHAAPYLMNRPGGPYAGSSHASAAAAAPGPYVMGSSAAPDVYGLSGTHPGLAHNLNPAAAATNHPYHHPSAATHAQPGHHYDNGATVVGGYAAAGYDAVSSSQYHHHPVYYPQ